MVFLGGDVLSSRVPNQTAYATETSIHHLGDQACRLKYGDLRKAPTVGPGADHTATDSKKDTKSRVTVVYVLVELNC